jgi:AcrR family transcriptional regulator
MARRKDDGFEERRQRIIDGALRVFAEQGFEEATNRDIAVAAGINSPGLIYHYFKDKEDLLRQVVEERVPLLQIAAHPDELEGLSPREALTRIARAYLRILDDPDAVNAFRLIIGEAARRPHLAQVFNEIGPNRVLGFLAAYLKMQMDSGALRAGNPALAARMFFSPLVVFILTREIFRQPEARALDSSAFVEETVNHFLRAMER